MEEKYILTLDIGTSTIRSYIYNSRTETVGTAVDQVIKIWLTWTSIQMPKTQKNINMA